MDAYTGDWQVSNLMNLVYISIWTVDISKFSPQPCGYILGWSCRIW